MEKSTNYILTLSCDDQKAIVSSVTGFLSEHGGFILESAQYGDPETNRFFMRVVFTLENKDADLSKKFDDIIAKKFNMEWQWQDTSKKHRLLVMVSKFSHCLSDLLHRTSHNLFN